MHITVHNSHTQYSTEQFCDVPADSPDNHNCSDVIYWTGGGNEIKICVW